MQNPFRSSFHSFSFHGFVRVLCRRNRRQNDSMVLIYPILSLESQDPPQRNIPPPSFLFPQTFPGRQLCAPAPLFSLGMRPSSAQSRKRPSRWSPSPLREYPPAASHHPGHIPPASASRASRQTARILPSLHYDTLFLLYIIYYKGHASQKQASRRGTAPLNLFPRERRRSRGGAGRNLPPSPLFQPEKIFPASLKGFPAPGRISYERASKEMIA